MENYRTFEEFVNSKDFQCLKTSVMHRLGVYTKNEDLEQEAAIAAWKAWDKSKQIGDEVSYAYLYSTVLYSVRRAYQNDKLVHVPINQQSTRYGSGANTIAVEFDAEADHRTADSPESDIAIDIRNIRNSTVRSFAEYIYSIKEMPNGSKVSIRSLAALHGVSTANAKDICTYIFNLLERG